MILKFLKIIVIFLLRIYSKRTGKTHQSLVIATLEYIPKEKGGKRRFQKNIEAFLEGGKNTLEVAKTLDKIGFFKNKTEEEKKVQQTQEKSVWENLGGKRTKKVGLFVERFPLRYPLKKFYTPIFVMTPL
jgi:hypothetical protein